MSLYPKIEESLTDNGRVVKYPPQIYRNVGVPQGIRIIKCTSQIIMKIIHFVMEGNKPFNHGGDQGLVEYISDSDGKKI